MYSHGCLLDDDLLSASAPITTPHSFTAPEYIDSRPYCLPPNNQGDKPWCVGFATAGYGEVQNWKDTHHAIQYDAEGIYHKAKAIDGNDRPGTYLSSGFLAAQTLGYIPESSIMRTIKTREDLKFALHRHDVVIGSFRITQAWFHVNSRTGIIGDGDELDSGHAVLMCYYDKNYVGIQNSWDAKWGINGMARMTWDHFDKHFKSGLVAE